MESKRQEQTEERKRKNGEMPLSREREVHAGDEGSHMVGDNKEKWGLKKRGMTVKDEEHALVRGLSGRKREYRNNTCAKIRRKRIV